ncbi:MAG: DUF362 domain-containing protein [Spirochaetaceae bacterium]|nr:MAG: DUF362 domain-containing protein [Spirochaetaceae bacterium]
MAVKIHIGEGSNTTHVSPGVVREIVHAVKRHKAFPFLTETSTLYKGNRSDAVTHLMYAYSRGYSFDQVGAPFIMADGLTGNTEIEIPIRGVLFDAVNIAREITMADALIAVTHPTGHIGLGLGASLKNLGMGLSSRIGKLRQHSSITPYIEAEVCTFCLKCMEWCPEDAIVEKNDKAFIVDQKCVGCGECLSACNFNAVKYNFAVESADLQRRVAEHALGVMANMKGRALFLNFLIDMTKDCDCIDQAQKPILPDAGILASADPVAADQATLDITKDKFGSDLGAASYSNLDPAIQIEHAARIGLGSRNYRLIRLD